jgi:hypothetical protein
MLGKMACKRLGAGWTDKEGAAFVTVESEDGEIHGPVHQTINLISLTFPVDLT